jgi:hypothetical protein
MSSAHVILSVTAVSWRWPSSSISEVTEELAALLRTLGTPDTRDRRIARWLRTHPEPGFRAQYEGTRPSFSKLRHELKRVSRNTAKLEQPESSLLGEMLYTGLESSDAVLDVFKAHNEIFDCLVHDLGRSKLQAAVAMAEKLHDGSGGVDACLDAIAHKSNPFLINAGFLVPFIEQTKLWLRGQTTLSSAAAHATGEGFLTALISGAFKILGTVIGGFLGNAATAIWGGIVLSAVAAKGFRAFIRRLKRNSLDQAFKNLGEFYAEIQEEGRCLRAEAIRDKRALASTMDAQWAAEWNGVWALANGRLAGIYNAYCALKQELVEIGVEELKLLIDAHVTGRTRRDWLAGLSIGKRAVAVCWPEARSRVSSHFVFRTHGLASLLVGIETASTDAQKLDLLLKAIVEGKLSSPRIEAALGNILVRRKPMRTSAVCVVEATVAQLCERFLPLVKHYYKQRSAIDEKLAKALRNIKTKVNKKNDWFSRKADGVGMTVVFSTMPTSSKKRRPKAG